MIKTMSSPSELWHVRKQMTLQMASFIFATYILCVGSRVPSRIHISRSTGNLYTSDMLPCVSALLFSTPSTRWLTRLPLAIPMNKAEFTNVEPVPFRFTPNLQRFVTPIGTEGLLTTSMLAIARCLTESEVWLRPLPIHIPSLTVIYLYTAV